MTRRELFAGAAYFAAFRNDTLSLVEKLLTKTNAEPQDEEFWFQIRQAFAVDPTIVNFNNGGCCPSPRIVQECLRRQIEFSNQAPSFYMWRNLEPEIEGVRRRLAASFGCDAEEMAITRNASEALEILLMGLPLAAGDEVLTTNQDYPRMITTLKQRERRDGIKLVQVKVPAAPATHAELVKAFENGITSKTKLILVSQVVFLTGQIYPVKDIVNLGRKHGIPVVVDGAHAFAQYEFTNQDLDCEYYGTSLHKWLMAPVGTGFLYVKKANIPKVWPLMAAVKEQDNDIRKFEEIGTHPAANHNAIGEALTFHELIGPARKEKRLRYLRSRWTDKLQDSRVFRFNTNLNREHSCALTNVEIIGMDPGKLAEWLLAKHDIFVTTIVMDDFRGIRVTPNVYTTVGEIDRFASAMLKAGKDGVG